MHFSIRWTFVLAVTAISFQAMAFNSRIVESFKISPPDSKVGALDILWVVDDSGSMAEHQNLLATQSTALLSKLQSRGDWQMAMVTTDVSREFIFGFDATGPIRNTTVNAATQFNSWMNSVGTNGSSNETPIDVVGRLIQEKPNYFRKSSKLALIVVTDEIDQSKELPSDLLASLQSAGIADKGLHVFNIILATDLGCNNSQTFNYLGSPLDALLRLAQGEALPLCKFESAQAAELSEKLAKLTSEPAQQVFELREVPVLNTLRLKYSGREIPQGHPGRGYWLYDYQSNAIYIHDFSFMKPESDQIEIDYFE